VGRRRRFQFCIGRFQSVRRLFSFFCNFVILATHPPESGTVSRAPVYHILWVRGFRAHTISGRGFNFFKPLRRHFRPTPFCRPVLSRRDSGNRNASFQKIDDQSRRSPRPRISRKNLLSGLGAPWAPFGRIPDAIAPIPPLRAGCRARSAVRGRLCCSRVGGAFMVEGASGRAKSERTTNSDSDKGNVRPPHARAGHEPRVDGRGA
jgi:hypothetical protein